MKEISRASSDSEFPLLASLKLYAADTTGDGNCLFRALSDQLYGNEARHKEIRSQAMGYMKAHADRFAAFVGEYGESFEAYVRRVAQDSVYGGHLEIVAAAEHYQVEIAIYQADTMYVVQPSGSQGRSRLHIAYHTWEHYSSVRNKAGPHSGHPQVEPAAETAVTPAAGPPQWKIDIVSRSCPEVSESRIREMLQTKDYEQVIEDLLLDPEPKPDCTSLDSVLTVAPEQVPRLDPTLEPRQESRPTATAPPTGKRVTAREKREAARKRALDRKLNKHKRKNPESAEPSGSKTDPALNLGTKTIYI